jgi:hypothetical protein
MERIEHWGVTGWSTEWTNLDDDDGEMADSVSGRGFVRVVEPGVVYHKPPVAGTWAAWRECPQSHQRRYEMGWPEAVAPQMFTVLDIHARLIRQRESFKPGDDELRNFDAEILELLHQVERLHRAGGILGFVQPDSVVFCRMRDGSLQVAFPDVGFAWDESRGLREPRWIADPQLDCLFEEGARRQNLACLAALQEAAAGGASGSDRTGKRHNPQNKAVPIAEAQARDVRLLARLLAVALVGPDEVNRWCGAGRAFLAVPGRDRAPDTQAPVWDQVITPALLDKIPSVSALRERVELAPPSGHYLFKPPTPPPPWKVAVKRVLPGLIGVGGMIAMLLVAQPILKRPTPHVLCSTVFQGDPRFEQLDGIEKARAEAQVGELDKVQEFWELIVGAKSDLPGPCLVSLQDEAISLIREKIVSLTARLRDEPLPRTKQIELLQEAYRLAVAANEVQPDCCSRAIALLVRQLEARGELPDGAPRPMRGRSVGPGGDAHWLPRDRTDSCGPLVKYGVLDLPKNSPLLGSISPGA